MNQSPIQKERLSPYMWLLLSFCFMASLNVINRYFYFIFIAFFIFALFPGRRLVATPALIPLFVLGIAWAIFAPAATDSIFGPLKPFTYMLCFIMGFGLAHDARKNEEGIPSEKLFFRIAATLAAGTLAHYLLNWLKNGNSADRNTMDFWTGTTMAATGQAAMACLPLALAIACLFSPVSKKLKLTAIAVLTVVLGYNLVLSGRTIFLLSAIAIAVAFCHRTLRRKRGRILSIALFFAVIAALILAYGVNLFGIRSLIEASPFYDRFFGEHSMELTTDGRLDKKLFFLQNFGQSILGGAHLRDLKGYAHDLFLDTYDEAGILALLAVVAYILSSIRRMIRCVFDNRLSFIFRQVVLCAYVVLYAEFMVEPILQGMPWLFASFCLLDGYVARVLNSKTPSK